MDSADYAGIDVAARETLKKIPKKSTAARAILNRWILAVSTFTKLAASAHDD
jgi:hypothetical protein